MIGLFKIAVLTSGHSRGSNFKAIYQYINDNKLPIVVDFVLITEQDPPIKEYCASLNIETIFYDGKSKINSFLLELFKERQCDLIVLAGFMRKLSEQFLDTINTPLINIHPALLPKYGGKGMYGSNVHNAVFTAGEKISGATVHYVNKNYDEGDIIMQQSVDITDCQSPEEIGKKVLAIEHQIYGAAIEKILLGRTSLLKD